MDKEYSLHSVARNYVRGYYKYLIKKTNVRKVSDAYILLSYSIHKLYDIDTIEVSKVTDKYGVQCEEYLRKRVNNVPSNPDKLPLDTRVYIVELVKSYSVYSDILSYNSIIGGRSNGIDSD